MKYIIFFLLYVSVAFLPIQAAQIQTIPVEKTVSIVASIKDEPPTQPVEYKKAMILAFLIFVGIGGMHRLYMGYKKEGIIQFATIGMGGIWQIIDIVRMITGELKPKNGEFVMPPKREKKGNNTFNRFFRIFAPKK